jgi:hypothetical protein
MESRGVELPDHLWSEPLEKTFTFRNAGTGDLYVSVEKTSCGCTAAVVSDAAVPAGGSGRVRLTYTPNPKDKQLGERTFTAYLKSNDPRASLVVLEMKCRMTDTVAAAPEALEFGGAGTLPLTITCYHWNGPRKVLSIEPSSGDVVLRALPVEEEGTLTRYRYDATLGNVEPGKTFRASIVVRTDSPEVPVLEIPVRAEPPSRLDVTPPKLLFGAVRAGKPVTRKVMLKPNDPKCVPVRVVSEDPRVRAALEPGAGGTYALVATFELPGAGKVTEKVKSFVEVLDGEGRTVGNVEVFALLSAVE